MIISSIVSMSNNSVIGKGGKIPWEQSEDLKRFRKLTLNHIVIMGKNTYKSIGSQLDKRINIIITSDKEFKALGCYITHSPKEALEAAAKIISDGYFDTSDEVFIIGGGEIYKQFLPLCDNLYITEINCTIDDGDTFFPEIDKNIWTMVYLDGYPSDEKNDYDYMYIKYIKDESRN